MKRAYDALLYGMAYIAAFLMAAMMVVITVDVVLRTWLQSSAFLHLTEYALLVSPCRGAPGWRAKGPSTSRPANVAAAAFARPLTMRSPHLHRGGW